MGEFTSGAATGWIILKITVMEGTCKYKINFLVNENVECCYWVLIVFICQGSGTLSCWGKGHPVLFLWCLWEASSFISFIVNSHSHLIQILYRFPWNFLFNLIFRYIVGIFLLLLFREHTLHDPNYCSFIEICFVVCLDESSMCTWEKCILWYYLVKCCLSFSQVGWLLLRYSVAFVL